MSIEKLAFRTGIAPDELRALERGDTDILDLPAQKLAALARTLHISADVLIGEKAPSWP